jgi:hypothetical protein
MNFSDKYKKREANILELTCHVCNPTMNTMMVASSMDNHSNIGCQIFINSFI